MYGPEDLEELRQEYPKGTRIELISTEYSSNELKPGDKGTVLYVDNLGNIYTDWDCGSKQIVIFGEDIVIKM